MTTVRGTSQSMTQEGEGEGIEWEEWWVSEQLRFVLVPSVPIFDLDAKVVILLDGIG